jgi:hypothetical protein
VAKIYRIRNRKDLDRAIASLAASDAHMRRIAKLVGLLPWARESKVAYGFQAMNTLK